MPYILNMNVRYPLFFLIFVFQVSLYAHINSDRYESSPEDIINSGVVPEEIARPEAIMHVSEAMKAFVHEHISMETTRLDRLNRLLDLLVSEDKFGFRYEYDKTLTAEEAFEQRCGNCLTFSILTAALARELDLDVYFNSVETTPAWETLGDLVTEEYHMNLLARVGADYYVVELLPYFRNLTIRAETQADSVAFGRYYNNLGVWAISENKPQLAEAYFKQAIRVDLTCHPAWRNLGALKRMQGAWKEAKICLERAAAIRPKSDIIYQMLAQTCTDLGEMTKAAHYEKLMEDYRKSNPMYHFAVGQKSMIAGDLKEAKRHLKKAISLNPDCHYFYYALACVYEREHDYSHMREALEQALKCSATDSAQDTYSQIIASLPTELR